MDVTLSGRPDNSNTSKNASLFTDDEFPVTELSFRSNNQHLVMKRILSYHMCDITRSHSAMLVLAVYESFVIVHYIWFCEIAQTYSRYSLAGGKDGRQVSK